MKLHKPPSHNKTHSTINLIHETQEQLVTKLRNVLEK